MQTHRFRPGVVLAAALLALIAAGCTRKARQEQHIAKAESFMAEKKLDEAEIEYKNALQADSNSAESIGQLGTIYFDQGRLTRAIPFLIRSKEMQPENLELRTKLALGYLAYRDFAAARTEAEFLLGKNPLHEEAPLILVATATNPTEAEAVLQRLNSLPAEAKGRPAVILALATLDLRKGDAKAGEAGIRRALELDPKMSAAHSSLAALLMSQRNSTEAEKHFQAAAENSPLRSPRRLQYAEFKLQAGDPAGARKVLEEVVAGAPDYLPGLMTLANLSARENKIEEVSSLIDRILTRDETFPEALLLKARLRMSKGEFKESATDLENSLRLFPSSPQFHHYLGLAYAGAGESTKAIESLSKALQMAPGLTDASVLLATLHLRRGQSDLAIVLLKNVVQQRPDLLQPWYLLADAFRAHNDLDQALKVYEQLEKGFPDRPQTFVFKGLTYLSLKRPADARKAFDAALALAPEYPPALEQIVNLDLAEQRLQAARERIEGLIVKYPKVAELQLMLAKVFVAEKTFDKAEAAINKAIELRPDFPTAYFMLAALYLTNNEQDKALANLEQVAAKNPKDLRALMLVALLNERKKNYEGALAAYQKVLEIDPKFSAALNNVAYLYAERFNQLDKAQEMAQRARELLPTEPHVADTLGWILYRRQQYPWALTLLQESAEKLPNSAEVQYHLGMAHYMMGEESAARLAIERALQLSTDFPGVEDARKRLELLVMDVDKIAPSQRAELKKTLSAMEADPVALVRLAAVLEADGALDEAVGALQTALKANAKNLPALLRLARLHGARNEPAKALETAKEARKLAPDDAATSLELGRIAYRTGDYAWSYSLLQDVARKLPNQADVLFDLARAAYAVGRTSDAENQMRQFIAKAGISPRVEEAKEFLELVGMAADPAKAAAGESKAAQLLKTDARNVPALMVSAVASERRFDQAAALATYEKILEVFPEFNPAKRSLAIIYSAQSQANPKALAMALKARESYPNDVELGKAIGVLFFRGGEFSRALPLLRDAASKRTNDAEVHYFLGATQFRLKDVNAAKQSLNRAISLKLNAELTAEAQKLLAEAK